MNIELPRVLFAIALFPGAQFGSAEEQMLILAQTFEQNGGLFLPLFITNAPQSALKDYTARNLRAVCMNLQRFNIQTLLQLAFLIRKHRIQVVHWNFISPLRNPYLWGLTILCPRLRHAMTDHISRTLPRAPPPSGFKRAIKRLLAMRYRTVFCVSKYVHDCQQSEGIWPTLVTQHHFINTERFTPNQIIRDELRQLMKVEDRTVALFVGHLIPEKGVDVAIRAFVEAPQNMCLWIVGGGPAQADITFLVESLGLSDRVKILGPQPYVQKYMQAADVLLCPSKWAEAAGLVNLEAQATGLPVIGSRIGGIPDYVIHDRTGLLFEPGDCHELACQLRRLIDEPDLLPRLSKNARPWVVEHFSPEARIPEVLDNYRKLVGGP